LLVQRCNGGVDEIGQTICFTFIPPIDALHCERIIPIKKSVKYYSMEKGINTLWDDYLTYIQNMDEVSSELKVEVKEAYAFLRSEFGEKFLLSDIRGHAVAAKIFQRAPWQLEDLVSFVNVLKELRDMDSNYSSLLSKLRPRDRSRSEGVPIVELARMILLAGLRIKIEPEVQFRKKPDLEISNPFNGESIYGELSILDESDERKGKSDIHFVLFRMIETTPPYLHYSCKLNAKFGSEKFQEMEEFVNKCKEEVINNKSFQIFENSYFIVGLAVEERLDDLKEWIESNQLNLDEISGLELDYDDSKRIVNNKIDEKARQLPDSHNGLIFIRVKPLFFFSDGVNNVLPLAQMKLGRYPHVVGLIIYSTIGFQKDTSVIPLDGGFLSLKQIDRLTSRYTLFILNKKTDLKIADDTLKKIFALCGS